MNTNTNTTIIIGLLALIAGLIIGYSSSGMRMGWTGGFGFMQEMHEEMEGYHDDALIAEDGAMQHAMDEMMLTLRGREGSGYEEQFLRVMIVHHLGAIAMAEDLQRNTERPELTELAGDIVAAQTREVEMMRSWLAEWFGVRN